MNRPNFLVIGAPKCGTSALCHYLAQHPDVFVPAVKEPVFFDAEYERGLDYYWRTYFSEWSGEEAVGEGRVFLMYLPFVPARIRESLPEARLIAILRNPVDRAFSHWWHRFAHRNEELPFERAIEKNLERIKKGIDFDGPDGPELWARGLVHQGAMASRYRLYLDCGLYARQLQRYLRLFAPDQLRVVLYDDLRSDARSLMGELFAFLEVDPDAELGELTPRNEARATMQNRLRWPVERLVEASGLKRLVPGPLKRLSRGLFPDRPVEQQEMSAEVRRWLVEYYREPNRELAAILGRELSAWNE